MSQRWKERLWKLLFFTVLLVATAFLLAPRAPAVGPSLPYVDKLQHIVLFAGLALLGTRAYQDKPRWGVAVALVFYGACIELGQARTGRSFELLDILADAIGTTAVFLAPKAGRTPSAARTPER